MKAIWRLRQTFGRQPHARSISLLSLTDSRATASAAVLLGDTDGGAVGICGQT